MVEQVPYQYLRKVLELSQEMVRLASLVPERELHIGCRTLFGTLCDYGCALESMAAKELAAHEAAEGALSEVSSLTVATGLSSCVNPKTVLIVDDDRDFLKYLSLLFQDNGFETLTAIGGHEAAELASTRKPDLITLDISMPGKSGVSAYRDFREDPELAAVPVVLITAIGDSLGQVFEMSREMSDRVALVSKPFDVALLWEAVRDVFGETPR